MKFENIDGVLLHIQSLLEHGDNVIDFLIEFGKWPQSLVSEELKTSVLHLAIKYADVELIRYLLKHNKNAQRLFHDSQYQGLNIPPPLQYAKEKANQNPRNAFYNEIVVLLEYGLPRKRQQRGTLDRKSSKATHTTKHVVENKLANRQKKTSAAFISKKSGNIKYKAFTFKSKIEILNLSINSLDFHMGMLKYKNHKQDALKLLCLLHLELLRQQPAARDKKLYDLHANCIKAFERVIDASDATPDQKEEYIKQATDQVKALQHQNTQGFIYPDKFEIAAVRFAKATQKKLDYKFAVMHEKYAEQHDQKASDADKAGDNIKQLCHEIAANNTYTNIFSQPITDIEVDTELDIEGSAQEQKISAHNYTHIAVHAENISNILWNMYAKDDDVTTTIRQKYIYFLQGFESARSGLRVLKAYLEEYKVPASEDFMSCKKSLEEGVQEYKREQENILSGKDRAIFEKIQNDLTQVPFSQALQDELSLAHLFPSVKTRISPEYHAMSVIKETLVFTRSHRNHLFSMVIILTNYINNPELSNQLRCQFKLQLSEVYSCIGELEVNSVFSEVEKIQALHNAIALCTKKAWRMTHKSTKGFQSKKDNMKAYLDKYLETTAKTKKDEVRAQKAYIRERTCEFKQFSRESLQYSSSTSDLKALQSRLRQIMALMHNLHNDVHSDDSSAKHELLESCGRWKTLLETQIQCQRSYVKASTRTIGSTRNAIAESILRMREALDTLKKSTTTYDELSDTLPIKNQLDGIIRKDIRTCEEQIDIIIQKIAKCQELLKIQSTNTAQQLISRKIRKATYSESQKRKFRRT